MKFNRAKSAAVLAVAVLLSFASAGESRAGGCGDLLCNSPFEDCSNCPGDCGPCCGNGNPDAGEGCDDAGTFSGDGCSENCLIETGYGCGTTGFPVEGENACESGICDADEEPICADANICGNSVCEEGFGENCETCAQDCNCPSTTTTTSTTSTTTSMEPSTTTSMEPTTTTSMEPSTTTTSTSTTSSTTMQVLGACCFSNLCQVVEASYCTGELQGSYQGDDSTCDEPGICSECGNGCVEFSEECDDADSQSGDGCDSNCQEEQCFFCNEGQLTGDTGPAIVCPGGGPSFCSEDVECTICGDGITEGDEQCDPGKEPNPCCDDCEFVAAQTSCSDGVFCDGAETCDGSGNCNSGTPPTCAHLDDECVEGVCDPKLDVCVSDLDALNGEACSEVGACSVGEGGVCNNGVCTGAASTLSPSCRWIIVGGSPSDDVRVRTGPGSTVDADMCGDTARIGGITSDDIVAIAPTGEGIRFYGPPEVDGDIVTGGSTVRSNLYLTIPGTAVKTIDTLQVVAKTPAGVVDTTGSHALVDVCSDDQAILAAAVATLEGMASDGTEGLKVPVGSSFTIDVTPNTGVSVIDLAQLKVSHGATLTLRGDAADVLMLRINDGRLKVGYGASVVLDGLVPENVLIYNDGPRCRVSPGVVGAGTIFCPEAGRFIVGSGVNWSGTFLGASREVRVRKNAALTHVPFTGF